MSRINEAYLCHRIYRTYNMCVSIIKSKINKSTRLLMLMFVLEIEICSRNIGKLRNCLNIFHIGLCVWMGPLETFRLMQKISYLDLPV